MKLIKNSEEIITLIRNEFEKYLQNLKDGADVSFKLEMDKLTTVTKPKIIFTKDAYCKMLTLVNNNTGEVGWNGTVERDDLTFKITDILVYPQDVTGTTVTCDEIETGVWLNSFPNEIFNKIRFQAHSHVNMTVTPSSVDRAMYDKYESSVIDDGDYYIFMIVNKKGDFFVELYDTVSNKVYYYKDVDIEIEGMSEFLEQAKSNIREYKYTPQTNNKPKNKEGYDYMNCTNDCRTCDRKNACYEYYLGDFD